MDEKPKQAAKIGSDKNNRRYNGVSQSERKEHRRRALIDAAIELFGTSGYANSTVKAICAHAKLTERYFYESFNNKEHLLAEAYQIVTEEIQHLLIDAAGNATEDTLGYARASITAFFEFMYHQRAKARLFMLEVLGVSETIDELYRQCGRDMDALVLATAGSISRGDDHPWALDIVAQGLTGTVINVCVQWILSDYRAPLDDVINSSFLVFESVIRTLQTQED